jgi:hypothetical protein
MGQSAGIYRISAGYFATLREANGNMCFDGNLAAECAVFVKSQCGLEHVLCKIFPDSTELIKEIFCPKDEIGPEIKWDDIDAFQIAFDQGRIIPYIPPGKVSMIVSLLRSIDERLFVQNYQPDEMNKREIYPSGVWAAGRDEDRVFNELHLLHDVHQLREIFAAAESGGDYLVVYVG